MVMQNPVGPTVFGSNVIAFPASVQQKAAGLGLGADQGFRAHAFFESQRRLELAYRASFYRCRQHDTKSFDFNGAMIPAGSPVGMGGLIGANQPSMYVPLAARRPSAPVRLLRTIVKRFTAMLFGEGRFPAVKVPGDARSTDFYEALVKAEKLQHVCTRARNLGGSVGTVGWSWRFIEGKPRVRVHSGENLHVHEWADREELIPKHVSQILVYEDDIWDPEKRQMKRARFWHRRDWTEEADVAFLPVEVKNEEPFWQVDEENSVEHGDGFCHFVWTQNQEPDEEMQIDGLSDYGGSEETSNTLDVLNSVVMRGAANNLDPTLVLKMKRTMISGAIRKGSDNALVVGESGDARYMTVEAGSLVSGSQLVKDQRDAILEECECIIPDPSELTAANATGRGIELLFAPMIAKLGVFRVTYGTAIERLLEQQARSYKRMQPVVRRDDDGAEVREIDVEIQEDGTEVEVKHSLDLPPKVTVTEVLDETGEATGEADIQIEEVELGERIDLVLEWPPAFAPTEGDKQNRATTLVSANGGKPLISQKSAVEDFARLQGRDPKREWAAMQQQSKEEEEKQLGMFPGAGGGVGELGELPPGAGPVPAPEPKEEPKAKLPDGILPSILFVNEARKMAGHPPIPEADGFTVKEWEAMRAAKGAEAGKAVGAAEGAKAAEMIAPTPDPVEPEPEEEPVEPEPPPVPPAPPV